MTLLVPLIGKHPDGEILGLSQDWGLTSKPAVVQDMLTGSARYHVMVDGERQDPLAAPAPAFARGPHLRLAPQPIALDNCRRADRPPSGWTMA